MSADELWCYPGAAPKIQGGVEPPMAERLTRAKIEKFVVCRRACGKVRSGPLGQRSHRPGLEDAA